MGINGWEALVLLLVVLLVVGPDKLPEITHQVAGWINSAREFLRGARESVSRELGEDLDLGSLDPRQYDPRRVVRDALFDDAPASRGGRGGPGGSRPVGPRMWERGSGSGAAGGGGTAAGGAPFDHEAT
ncbi:MAG: twin-arginine translocase TatA/TatE family subunit [bacterium]|nr:twin-arginine translocase TatA/TatE family subunit [bacterium]